MIIGNNNGFNANNAQANMHNNAIRENNNFQTKFNRIKEEAKNNKNNLFVQDLNSQIHSDPTNRKDMTNKSLAMLQERLNQGLISYDEFNKKCEQLRKKN